MFEFEIFKPYSDRLKSGVTPDAFSMKDAVMADQVHGDFIMEVNEKPDELPQCDAFITRQKELPIMVKVADCQGIILYDPTTHSAAAVHSGWRSSCLNILGKAVKRMQDFFGSSPTDLVAAISPSLGPCCAEFSDPKIELPAFCYPFIRDNNHVDFWGLSMSQLQAAGIPPSQIECAGQCTKCQPGFLSHRKGDSGRMGVFVKLL
ncbi:polyphenol oxidase family protein [Candidatus Peregrinibacteria bacterium]|nr:polyphenol oxidase family protein [Candidatus Peregrinibacteria bacterium]